MEKQHASFAGNIPIIYEKYLGPFLFEPYALDIITRLKVQKYTNILEMACGTGSVTANLDKLDSPGILTATDLNKDMIELAKQFEKNKNIEWHVADALDLPFEKNSFDAIVCQFGVMFFPDKLKGLQEAY